MIIVTRRVVLISFALAACARAPDHGADVAAIETLMRARFDRPDAPLGLGPVVVDGDYAVADWTQGEMGGRALLQRSDSSWSIVLCAGDDIRSAAGLRGVGIPPTSSSRLARALSEAERGLQTSRLALMSRFEGVVRMRD